jgi:transposase
VSAGRPTKLTPETVKKLCVAIQQGATYALACKYAGISYDTFNDWKRRGAEEEARRQNPRVQEGTAAWTEGEEFIQFLQAIQKAEGDAALGWLLKIELAATAGHWQAAAWKLERRYPQEYGRTVVTQDVPPLTPEQIAAMPDEDLDAYIAKLQKLSNR